MWGGVFCECSARGGQKKALHSLELELHTAVILQPICWEQNLGPRKERHLFLTSKASLHSIPCFPIWLQNVPSSLHAVSSLPCSFAACTCPPPVRSVRSQGFHLPCSSPAPHPSVAVPILYSSFIAVSTWFFLPTMKHNLPQKIYHVILFDWIFIKAIVDSL